MSSLSQNLCDFLHSLEAQSIPAWEHNETPTTINCEFFSKTNRRICYISVCTTTMKGKIQAGFYIINGTSKNKDYDEGTEHTLVSDIADFIKQTTHIDVDSSAFKNGYNPLEWTLRSIKSIVEGALQQLGKR